MGISHLARKKAARGGRRAGAGVRFPSIFANEKSEIAVIKSPHGETTTGDADLTGAAGRNNRARPALPSSIFVKPLIVMTALPVALVVTVGALHPVLSIPFVVL